MPTNENQATQSLKERADAGDVEAQKALALLNELGIEPNTSSPTDAWRLWLAAAKKGDPWAQLSVARCYMDGHGTDVDMIEARFWMERAEAQGTSSAQVSERIRREPAKVKILAVDDSDVILRTIKADLEPKYVVVTATSAADAFKKLAEHHGVRLFISDVNMPEMDGVTMVEKLAAAGLLKRIQVIMLTTESAKELVLRGKKAGVAGWMIKPPKRELLLKAIERLLGDGATPPSP